MLRGIRRVLQTSEATAGSNQEDSCSLRVTQVLLSVSRLVGCKDEYISTHVHSSRHAVHNQVHACNQHS